MTEQPAGVPRRIVAFVVDLVLVSAVIFAGAVIVANVLGPVVRIHVEANGDRVVVDEGRAAVDAVMGVLVSAAYFVGFWARRGATPGQRLAGLRVVAGNGDAVTAPSVVGRWLVLVAPLSAIGVAGGASAVAGTVMVIGVALWYLVALVTTARDSHRRGVHDRWTGTMVARAEITHADA